MSTQAAADRTPGWPAITTEPRPWLRSGDEVASRRALLRASGDYNATVMPFITNEHPLLSPEVLAAADDASKELTRFDAEAGNIFAPFASILLRTESASSSEVENLTAGAKQVALAEIGFSKSENAKLVAANVRVMRAALELADDINESSIIEMHKVLLEHSAPQSVGSFRNEQVWIGGGRISPHGATFIPPHHERVEQLMRDLMGFVHRTDIPVLVQTAIAHAQFETIHPFPDGNGRTGRALIQSMLRHGGVTKNITVPVSAGLLGNTDGYFDALTAYRAGNPNLIVDALSEASFAAISNGRALVAQLSEVRERWNTAIKTSATTAPTRMKDFLLRQPVVTTKTVATELGVTEMTALRTINRFVEGGVLTQTNNWKRNRLWHAKDVLGALDSFGERARRKSL